MITLSIHIVLDSNHGKSMSLLPFMRLHLGSNSRSDVEGALKLLRIIFRLYTSEATGAQNYYCSNANNFDAMNFSAGLYLEFVHAFAFWYFFLEEHRS